MSGAKAQDDQSPNNFFMPFSLDLISNSANLRRILCNSGVAVPLFLLAIEEAVDCDVGVCGNNSPDYNGNECRFEHAQFAHIYIGTEIKDASVKHYIIAFVESTKIGRYKDLSQALCRTASWLKIENEKPYFYIYYHGKQPAFDASLIEARNNLTRELKSRLKNYQEEAFCYTSRVRTDAVDFTISASDPYQFKAS